MESIGSKSKSNIDGLNYEELQKIYGNQEKLNYRELCKRINIEEKSGNSKIKQMRELSGVFKYKKDGYKFIITEICDREVVDLFNNRSIYIPYIEILLSSIFEKNNTDELFFSVKEIMKNTGMINKNFNEIVGGDIKTKARFVAKAHGYDINNFYEYCNKGYNSILKPIVKSALNSMKNRKSIEIIDAYKAYRGNYYKYISVEDELGKEIFKIEGDVMTELGINGTNELYGSKIYLRDNYYRRCNEVFRNKCKNEDIFKDNDWNFLGFYRCYKIIINKKRLSYNISELKREFNNIIQNKMFRTKTLNFLTGKELDEFVKATIDIKSQNDYDFRKDIKEQELIEEDLFVNKIFSN